MLNSDEAGVFLLEENLTYVLEDNIFCLVLPDFQQVLTTKADHVRK